jgi:undecaprenyl-diphosphatase
LAWVAVGAAAGLAALTALVVTRSPVVIGLDTAGHRAVRAFGREHPAWLSVLSGVTHAGSTAALGIVAAVTVAVCLRAGRRADAIFIAVAAASSCLVSRAMRVMVDRPRPADRSWLVDGASFPSGHTANAAAAATILVIVAWPRASSVGRAVSIAGGAAFTGLIGLSRVAGGVHWQSDVVASCLVSVACVTTTAVFLTRRRVWWMSRPRG